MIRAAVSRLLRMEEQMSDSLTPREEVSLDLTRDEVHMLVYGLKDWSGPTDCTESLSRAFGFDGLDDFLAAGDRIANAISRREPLTVRDWTRALLATEVGWVSRVVGYSDEWDSIHAWTDEKSLQVLRSLQRKVPYDRSSVDR
ncbi:hypothetical protein [Mumia zhuanghuii]|uniref:Uncharacterized protein n=1 Tax=Mumia zhuanghuii TaxID=2585211 RepID=A0A5C4MLM9_9ACTN|nr:hypothetical protein [Mumia zhuanghuii]TNC33112.1 hypothetical protein FHE65_29545 [Mumia zhuanghuii]TNC44258.1 hypothetical protein FHE65_16745 [Mumia zhuanghuii]